jgi:hypothetical protein
MAEPNIFYKDFAKEKDPVKRKDLDPSIDPIGT